MFVLQYPVRPADITYDNIPHIGARIKPDQQKVSEKVEKNYWAESPKLRIESWLAQVIEQTACKRSKVWALGGDQLYNLFLWGDAVYLSVVLFPVQEELLLCVLNE